MGSQDERGVETGVAPSGPSPEPIRLSGPKEGEHFRDNC
jgi:hypothetical protein